MVQKVDCGKVKWQLHLFPNFSEMKRNPFIQKKSIISKQIPAIVICLLFCLFSCQKKGCTDPLATNYSAEANEDDGTCTYLTPNPIGCAVVMVSGAITSPTTWSVGNVYVIHGEVAVTSILTIQPGVIVKLDFDGILRVNNGGKIMAQGNSTSRIVFTSFKDDSYCGDSNGDGVATTAQKGDWVNLYLNGGNGNTFEYCDFFYAGADDGGYRCAVFISVAGPSFTFNNCTFAHTQSSASFVSQFAFYAGTNMTDPSVSIFTNNTFYDNNIPIYLSASYSINSNNTYSNPNNAAETNTKNCIWMYPFGGSNVAANYSETEVPYVMDGYLQKSSGSVTFGPNVTMKFPNSNSYGLNVSNLTISPSAFLTSLKDDMHGGDTNGDGNATTPASNDWYGVWDWTNSVWVNGSNILYAAN